MKKEVISERQGIVLIILFIIGSSVLIGTGVQAKQDAWVAVSIAAVLSTVVFLMFARILSLYPGKDLFDIMQVVFGKYLGKLLSLPFIWFAFHLGTLVIRNFSEFTNITVFPDTPVVLMLFFFSILCIWGVKAGIEVMGRWSEFFVIIVILLILLITALGITQMDIERIKPILSNGFVPVFKGVFGAFSFPFGEVVVFIMVFSNITKNSNYNKIFLMGLVIGGFLVIISVLRNLMILGVNDLESVYFPSNVSAGVIHIGELLQRMELIVTINFIVGVFVKVTICLLAVCKGITKFFNFEDYRFVVAPVTFLMFGFSIFIYGSTMEMMDWAFKTWPYYAMFFELILPFFVFIVVEIKKRKVKKIEKIALTQTKE